MTDEKALSCKTENVVREDDCVVCTYCGHRKKHKEEDEEPEEVLQMFKNADFVVEADPFMKTELWVRWSIAAKKRNYHSVREDRKSGKSHRIKWEEICKGVITYVPGSKTAVHLRIDILHGWRVLFYYPSGTYADWTTMESWLKDKCPAFDTHYNSGDNFSNVAFLMKDKGEGNWTWSYEERQIIQKKKKNQSTMKINQTNKIMF